MSEDIAMVVDEYVNDHHITDEGKRLIEYGYGLAQEEIDRLRNSGVKHILEQANEIEVLKDTIESQAKEIDRHISLNGELLKISCKQKDEISQLKEALSTVLAIANRGDGPKQDSRLKEIQIILNDKK